MSRLFAFLYDPVMRSAEAACLRAWRRDLLAGLSGEVLEIGAGTGANVPHYPDGVTRLVLGEPDPFMRARLDRTIAGAGAARRIETSDAPAHALPFADASFDAVVSTLVLCTVADPARVLGEVHRVLRPGGRLVFLEHVASDDAARLAWQRRLEPLWSRVAEGCHLTRRTAEAIRNAGFTLEDETRASMRKAPPWVRPTVRGVARRSAGTAPS